MPLCAHKGSLAYPSLYVLYTYPIGTVHGNGGLHACLLGRELKWCHHVRGIRGALCRRIPRDAFGCCPNSYGCSITFVNARGILKCTREHVIHEGACMLWVKTAKHYDTPGSQGISHPVLKGLNGG